MRKILMSGTAAALMLAAAGIAATPAGAVTELTFGMQDAEGNNVYLGVVAMRDRLEELSGGEMTLQLFPNSQLGDFRAMTEQLQEGVLDLTANGYPDMSYLIPELRLIGQPYVVSDYDHLLRIIDGPYGQQMDESFEDQGVRVLDVWYFGTRHTTSNEPIESIEDMSGLRLRTPNVDFLIDYARAVGAEPSPVAFPEVYLALQTNQVDAQENPLPTIEVMGFYEVQDYIALTSHFVASKAIMVSDHTWSRLTEEQQGWLIEAAEAGRDVNNALMFEQETELLDTFRERGLTVTEPDLQPFREAMQPFYDELEQEFGDGTVAELMAQ